jgi:uncharacterized SAM-binding protein YcdF (DUF218 family)
LCKILTLESEKRITSRLLRFIRIGVLILMGWALLAWIPARLLIVRADLPRADALFVFAGTYQERVEWAAQLYKEGRAPLILLTNDNVRAGWSSAHGRHLFMFERAIIALTEMGVPQDKIKLLPQPVSSTYEEAVQLRAYAVEQSLRSVLVVTSPYHSRRCLWTLRKVFQGTGIDIGINPAPPGEQSPTPATWWLSPTGWEMVAGDYLKIIYYRFRYR